MDFADTVWSSCSSKSQKNSKYGLRYIHNRPTSSAKSHHIADLLHQTGWTDLAPRRRSHICIRFNISLQNEIKYEKLS